MLASISSEKRGCAREQVIVLSWSVFHWRSGRLWNELRLNAVHSGIFNVMQAGRGFAERAVNSLSFTSLESCASNF